MKISRNPTRQGIRLRWHLLRFAAGAAMLAAFWFPKHAVDLVAIGLVILVGAILSKANDEDLLVEVFDDGDSLRFELGELHSSARMAEIEKVEFTDGGEGMDRVTVTLAHTTPFGRAIELTPQSVYVFDWEVSVWFADLQRRVQEAKSNALKIAT